MPNHRELLNTLLRQDTHLNGIYTAMSKDLARVLKKYKVTSNSKLWFKNTDVKKEVKAVMAKYQSLVYAHISNESAKAWELSNKHNDTLVNNYIKGVTVPNPSLFMQRNTKALQAFLQRRDNGLNLSDRVWNLAKATQSQLEYFIAEGLTEGRPATKLAKDLKRFLKQPDKRFRRIRDKETGKLKLSNPAENYKPGQGVYRSSYQNALRLARNETNIAYRTADYERRKQLPFVLGVTVNLSPAHPKYDICDELKGDYPKDFKFVAWHPNCLCFTTSKLASKEDFINHLKGKPLPQNKFVSTIPQKATDYLKENSERIKGFKNTPYFINDNFKSTKDGYVLKKEVGSVEVAPKPVIRKEVDNAGFVPAKDIAEAEQRILNLGVKKVTLKGLKKDEFNSVLKVMEKESIFSKINLDELSTYRKPSHNAHAVYSPSYNRIALNLSNLKKYTKDVVISYQEKIKKFENNIKEYTDNYLGKPQYKQATVKNRINSLVREINKIQSRIKNGEVSRPWSVSNTFDNIPDSLGATIVHEMGHYRHFKQLNETSFFKFSEKLSISEYGRTNPKEYLAEWYTHFRINGEKDVPSDLLKLFKTL